LPLDPIVASIVIPTRGRPDYLAVALSSIAPQAQEAGAEIVVVDDAGPSQAIRALVEDRGARYEPHPGPLGLNVARNTGVERTSGELVVFVDDDVEVAPGWLDALLEAARGHPEAEVFAGPIHARLEGGHTPHGCGRELPPITTLDLGPADTYDARFAWGANMAIRRGALIRVGPFDTTLEYGGDEQEWQERLRAGRAMASTDAGAATKARGELTAVAAAGAAGGRTLYVAAAAVDHRRTGDDARLPPLARAARARGRASRRFDAELRTLLGCLGHVARRRCPMGLTMAAHSLGRLEEGLRERRG
jgi:glycosyltransferase involved in cell wall biosynthesis